MKKLTQKQMGPWCSYCESNVIRALYREDHWRGKFACEVHKEKLQDHELALQLAEEHVTEADWETWMKL